MKKLSRRMCRHSQRAVQTTACCLKTDAYQTSRMNPTGPTASLLSRRMFASAPCLTLTQGGSTPMTVCNRTLTQVHELGFQRRCIATKPRSRTYYYDILGLTPKATQSQIKSAYYRLSKVYHPDSSKKDDGSKMFTEISEAYEILGNTKKRRMYDHGAFSRHERRADDHDYTQTFRQREGFSSERQAPPTGRTQMYNFDEFYRQHYGNAVRQEKVEREYWKQMQQQEKAAGLERKLRFAVTASVVVSLIAMFFINTGFTPGKRPKS